MPTQTNQPQPSKPTKITGLLPEGDFRKKGPSTKELIKQLAKDLQERIGSRQSKERK